MKATQKTVSAIITGSFLLLLTSTSQAGGFSINIGYSNFGYQNNNLPYSYKSFTHPKTIYYSAPSNVYRYNIGIPVYPKYQRYYQPGYTINNIYYINPGSNLYYRDRDKYYHNRQQYYSPGRYYKPQKIYMYKK